jgi:hypothetical protein
MTTRTAKKPTALSPLELVWRAQAKERAAWAAHKDCAGTDASTEARDAARAAWFRANRALVKLRGW